MSVLEYLQKFFKSTEMVKVQNVPDGILSKEWENIFVQEDIVNQNKLVIELWRKYVGDELSEIITYLEKHLKQVYLIKYPIGYSAIYEIEKLSGGISYYEGRFPLVETHELFDGMPLKIKEFYQNVNSSFCEFSSSAMGLLPISSVDCLDDYDWDILEDLSEPLKIDLANTYTFFSNGSYLYLVIDYSNLDNCTATIWSTDEEPIYGVDFWEEFSRRVLINWE